MAQPRRTQSSLNKTNINLANLAIEKGQVQSNQAAAALYKVNKNTLNNRRMGKPSRRDCVANSRILTDLEERVIIDNALDVNSRGSQLTLDILREMANKLLADQGSRRVGLH